MTTEAPEVGYLYSVIKPLVSFPDKVEILRMVDDKGTLLELSLHKEDMGKVIGKQGDTARAIRKIIRQFAAINNRHIALKINEPR